MNLPAPGTDAYFAARVGKLEDQVGIMRYQVAYLSDLVVKLTAAKDASSVLPPPDLGQHGKHAPAIVAVLTARPASGRQVADGAGCPLSTAQGTLRRLELAGLAKETPAGWIAAPGPARRAS